MQEQEIIKLLLKRDEKGMNALLLHYGPLIRYIIAPILPNLHDREDCLSEVTIRIWEKIEQFNPKLGNWNAWLTSIARNAALNYKRNTYRHNNIMEIPENTPSQASTPEEIIIQQELQSAVNHALYRLSAKNRVLFYRKYYYLQSTAQIASELGITERAVEGKLYRLKKQLRKMLGDKVYE